MSPSLNSEVVSLEEVPREDATGFQDDHELRKPIILIVDDEPLVADTLSAILSREGFTTMTAYDGITALELASEVTPHLLISDVAMPDMKWSRAGHRSPRRDS